MKLFRTFVLFLCALVGLLALFSTREDGPSYVTIFDDAADDAEDNGG